MIRVIGIPTPPVGASRVPISPFPGDYTILALWLMVTTSANIGTRYPGLTMRVGGEDLLTVSAPESLALSSSSQRYFHFTSIPAQSELMYHSDGLEMAIVPLPSLGLAVTDEITPTFVLTDNYPNDTIQQVRALISTRRPPNE